MIINRGINYKLNNCFLFLTLISVNKHWFVSALPDFVLCQMDSLLNKTLFSPRYSALITE